MKTLSFSFSVSLSLGAALLLGGCASVGPQSISANRPAYNMAVQQTNCKHPLN